MGSIITSRGRSPPTTPPLTPPPPPPPSYYMGPSVPNETAYNKIPMSLLEGRDFKGTVGSLNVVPLTWFP